MDLRFTLLNREPKISKEWNYELNDSLTPKNISYKSNKKVWWRCAKGHNYKTEVYRKTDGAKCPYCSNKKILPGFNDLATTHPELISIWSSKNKLKPSEVTFGSEKKVLWICNNGHDYEQLVRNVVNGSRCQYCSGQKVLKGFNDLESKFPNIAKEWNHKLNDTLKPNEVTFGSGKNVWWICPIGHEYQATITNRTKPTQATNCPYCSNRKVLPGFNDLATTNPELSKEWHPTKNDTLTPNEVTIHSNKNVNWICSLGHTWNANISNRSNGNNCPYCSNKKILPGFNDLATTHPQLAKEWHPTKNGTLAPTNISFGSSKMIWWKCKRNHIWKSYIYNRTKGSNCPECNNELKTSFPELALFYYIKKIFPDSLNRHKFIFDGKNIEGDIWIPSLNLVIEVDGSFYHKDSFKKDSNKNKIFLKNNINIIRIREIDKGIYLPEFEEKISCINAYLNSNEELSKMINSTFELISTNFNVNINLKISNSNINSDELEIRNLIYYLFKNNSLASLYPEIALTWHPIKNGNIQPENVSPYTPKNFWWICPIGHEFKTSVKSRVNGTASSCPYCSNQKILEGFNDLATTNPKLAKEFHPTKNGNLTPTNVSNNSHKKAWWICPIGHEYDAIISNRNNGTNCPYCSNQKILEGFNDLATTNPKLAKEFHPTKNGNLTIHSIMSGSGKKVWWLCINGHEWQQIVNNRNIRKSSCPYCKK